MENEKRLISTWEMMHKDNEGEAHITELHKYEYPTDDINITDMLIREALPTIVKPSRRKKPSRSDSRTIVAGDAQIPFQDDRAFEAFQTAIVEAQPDNIVFVGDMIDLPSLSRWEQSSEWAGGTQGAIDEYHNFLAQTRANAPDANIFVLHGNHENRLETYVRKNAAEVLGLRRANMSKELAVLSLQYLVRYDDLEVQCVDGYPNGILWLEDDLKITHGTHAIKGGSNASKYLKEERESTIYGHTHRQELAFRTFARRIGSVTIAAASPGCLSRIDGSVPGYRHTVDIQGDVVKRAEDWQHGLLVLDHSEKYHNITPVLFGEDGFMLDGKKYKIKGDKK